ncbi:MAG: nucleotidyltransferase domain-containing protein [Deltaproteobacteria bacterium]|nr:nucleotidyltransferase domain-containing protein [Deltaproteobacteria bacterium]
MPPADAITWHVLSDADRGRLRDAARRVLGRCDWVQAAYLYGSAARGRPARDIDVGLLAGRLPVEWGAELAVGALLAAESGLGRELFDVRVINWADPVFLNGMLREGGLLYEADREARIRFEALAMAQWLDFRPAWERVRAEVLRRWAGGQVGA